MESDNGRTTISKGGNQQNYLEACRLIRLGSREDLESAIEYLKLASSNGHIPATIELGKIYSDPRFHNLDIPSAERLFMSAANRGNVESRYLLGMLYIKTGGAQERKKGIEQLRRAANTRYHPAVVALESLGEMGFSSSDINESSNEHLVDSLKERLRAVDMKMGHEGNTDDGGSRPQPTEYAVPPETDVRNNASTEADPSENKESSAYKNEHRQTQSTPPSADSSVPSWKRLALKKRSGMPAASIPAPQDSVETMQEPSAYTDLSVQVLDKIPGTKKITCPVQLCEYYAKIGHRCRLSGTESVRDIPALMETLCNLYDDSVGGWFTKTLCNLGITAPLFITKFSDEGLRELYSMLLDCLAPIREHEGYESLLKNTGHSMSVSHLNSIVKNHRMQANPSNRHHSMIQLFVAQYDGSADSESRELEKRLRTYTALYYNKVVEYTHRHFTNIFDNEEEKKHLVSLFAELGVFTLDQRKLPHLLSPVHYLIGDYRSTDGWDMTGIESLGLSEELESLRGVLGADECKIEDYLVAIAAVSFAASHRRRGGSCVSDIDFVFRLVDGNIRNPFDDLDFEGRDYTTVQNDLCSTLIRQTLDVKDSYIKNIGYVAKVKSSFLIYSYKGMIHRVKAGDGSKLWISSEISIEHARDLIDRIDRNTASWSSQNRSSRGNELEKHYGN